MGAWCNFLRLTPLATHAWRGVANALVNWPQGKRHTKHRATTNCHWQVRRMQAPAAPRPASQRPSLKLPMPLVFAATLAASAYMFLNSKKPIYYDVEEGDTLCTISECHNRDYRDIYVRNKDIIHDPDLIYPGDRCVPSASRLPCSEGPSCASLSGAAATL